MQKEIKITRENLMRIPIGLFKGLYIRNGEEEKIVQEVLDERTKNKLSEDHKGFTKVKGIPQYIKTREEEEYWQKIVDEKRGLRNVELEAEVNLALEGEEPTESTGSDETLLQDELVSLEAQKLELETSLQAPTETRFCDGCDAKGPIKHKKYCTK